MTSRNSILAIALLLLLLLCLSANKIDFPSAAQSQAQPSFIELGYGPGNLESIQNGIPIYAPGDSMWLLSTSSKVSSIQLISPNGTTELQHTITQSAVYDLYRFSSSDIAGNWSLGITLDNFSTTTLQIPFVNPTAHPIGVSLSNYTFGAGNLNLNFAVTPNNSFDVQTCLGSADVNSSIVIPIPAKLGAGEMLVIGGTRASELTFEGTVTSPFIFWFEMEYSYSYKGSLGGEYISRDISVFKSNTVVVSSPIPAALQISNSTSPREGRYTMNAYFQSSNGITVEQTTALLLNGLNWAWTGGCESAQVTSSSFTSKQSLQGDVLSWPTSLYYMYEVDGVDSYTQIPVSLKVARVDFVGSLSNSNLHYLGYTVAQNGNIDQSNIYDGSLFLVGRSFPLRIQVTADFGGSNLPAHNLTITTPYTIEQVVINVGEINASITNNTIPLSGASIVADNGQGGTASSSSNAEGIAVLIVPTGTYNVTVTSRGQSLTHSVSVTTDGKITLPFDFMSTSPPSDNLEYVLISLVIIGLLANIVLWLRPRR